MKKTKITLWERAKRIVAHAFNLETEQEIQERIERIKFNERQAQLRLEQREYINALKVEYADDIAQFHREREERLREEEKERKRQELIQLYRDNRMKQADVLYRYAKHEQAMKEAGKRETYQPGKQHQ